VSDHWHTPKVDWLALLSPSVAETIRRTSTRHTYGPREAVFSPTRNPEYVCLLEAGLVRISRVSPTGDEFTVGYVRPGEVFGEVSVLAGQPRESFAHAWMPSKVLRIPRRVFIRAVRESNPVLYELAKRVGERLLRLQSRAEDLVFHDTRTRLARLLLRLAHEFGHPADGGLVIGLPLTQEELGKLVGATRQTVSLALGELAAAGLVKRHGRELFLAQTQKLRRLAHLTG
jgi:CRP/FNR family transcriptional regulator, cyclic AMP receptor protein